MKLTSRSFRLIVGGVLLPLGMISMVGDESGVSHTVSGDQVLAHALLKDHVIRPDKSYKYLDGISLEHVDLYVPESYGSSGKIRRRGTLSRVPGARATMVICHGYMCDRLDTGFLRWLFPDYNVFSFDFRAHGQVVDEEQCCTFGKDEALEVMAAAEYVRNHPDLNHVPVGVYGFSMGAAASIKAQDYVGHLFDFMILDCAYSSTEKVIRSGLENIKFNVCGYSFGLPFRTLLAEYAYSPVVQMMLKAVLKTISNMDATATNTYIHPMCPAELVRSITVPCFFIHCKYDDKIPVEAAYDLYEGARGFKRLWLTNGRRHFDSFFVQPYKYRYMVNAFIDKILSGAYLSKEQSKIIVDQLEENDLLG